MKADYFSQKSYPSFTSRRQKLSPHRPKRKQNNQHFYLSDVKDSYLICERKQNKMTITIKIVINITWKVYLFQRFANT